MPKIIGFGTDPMDEYSVTLVSKATPQGLGVIITSPVRALEEKPGRSLIVLHDTRVPAAINFDPAYSYVNILWLANNMAGNHYHKVKREIFTVLAGGFLVYLKSLDGKFTEEIHLRAPAQGDTTMEKLYIREGIAHCVVALDSPSILHVLATSPNILSDEFPFEVYR